MFQQKRNHSSRFSSNSRLLSFTRAIIGTADNGDEDEGYLNVVLIIMHQRQLIFSLPFQSTNQKLSLHDTGQLLWCILVTSSQHYAQTLITEEPEEKWCYASFKSEAQQSRLIDDQHSLTLMRPRCPWPGPVQGIWDFLLTAPLSLILFAFSTAGTVIVGFNYFTTKWYR